MSLYVHDHNVHLCLAYLHISGWQMWCCPLHISDGKGIHALTLTQLMCLQRQERVRRQVDKQRFMNPVYSVSGGRHFRVRGERKR